MADSAWSQADEELGRAVRMTGPWLPNFLSWVSLLMEAGVVQTEKSLLWHEEARECLRAIHAIAAGGQVAVTIPDQGGRWFERLESSLPVAPGSAVAMDPPELASVEWLVHLLSVCDRPVGPVVAKLLAAGRLICSAQRLSDEGVAAPAKAGQLHLAALLLIQDVLQDQAGRSWKLFESLPVPAWSRVGPKEALQRRARLAGSASRVVLNALGVEESAIVRGGEAVEAHAAILDAIGDVRSVFGGNILAGSHLLTHEYGVRAGPEGMQALTDAKPRERREILYRSGALEAVAEFVEGQRKAFHAAIAGLGAGSSAARDWVHAVDALASTLYPPPALEATRFLLSPDGMWHERVRGARRRMGAVIGAEGLPELPRFVPGWAPRARSSTAASSR